MDPPMIIIGLEGLIEHSIRRITNFRNVAADREGFGRLSPSLKKLQVSTLLFGSIYRRLNRYDLIPGCDTCLGMCHDSLAQTQIMIEAVLDDDEDNAWQVSISDLMDKLPEEINNFISSVELLRGTYQEAETGFILQSIRELKGVRCEYSRHLDECNFIPTGSQDRIILDVSSEDDGDSDQESDCSRDTSLTEFEYNDFPKSKKSPVNKVNRSGIESLMLAGI